MPGNNPDTTIRELEERLDTLESGEKDSAQINELTYLINDLERDPAYLPVEGYGKLSQVFATFSHNESIDPPFGEDGDLTSMPWTYIHDDRQAIVTVFAQDEGSGLAAMTRLDDDAYDRLHEPVDETITTRMIFETRTYSSRNRLLHELRRSGWEEQDSSGDAVFERDDATISFTGHGRRLVLETGRYSDLPMEAIEHDYDLLQTKLSDGQGYAKLDPETEQDWVTHYYRDADHS